MRKRSIKNIKKILDIALAVILAAALIVLFIYLNVIREHYKTLYINDPTDSLLSIINWYSLLMYLFIGVYLSLLVLSSATISLVFKTLNMKKAVLYMATSVCAIIFIVQIDFWYASNSSLHILLISLNLIIPCILSIVCGIHMYTLNALKSKKV